MTRLDWNRIVDEAIGVRKSERLTQRDMASLAGVSLPTIVKFEKKSRSIQLEKAEQILRALGLVENSADPDTGPETPRRTGAEE